MQYVAHTIKGCQSIKNSSQPMNGDVKKWRRVADCHISMTLSNQTSGYTFIFASALECVFSLFRNNLFLDCLVVMAMKVLSLYFAYEFICFCYRTKVMITPMLKEMKEIYQTVTVVQTKSDSGLIFCLQ